MLDFTTPFGLRMLERLQREPILWFTTVDAKEAPQPRPIWFHWDGATVLIFSQPLTAKLRHIERRPRVAMHFNTDAEGNDYGVLLGAARVATEGVPAERVAAMVEKYRHEIPSIGHTVESWRAEWSVPILCTPDAMRGW
jgi:PPOX class probable F420-dependent enzyme